MVAPQKRLSWSRARLWSSSVSAALALRRLIGSGHCPTCLYDIRATPTRCPECGTTILTDGNPHPRA